MVSLKDMMGNGAGTLKAICNLQPCSRLGVNQWVSITFGVGTCVSQSKRRSSIRV